MKTISRSAVLFSVLLSLLCSFSWASQDNYGELDAARAERARQLLAQIFTGYRNTTFAGQFLLDGVPHQAFEGSIGTSPRDHDKVITYYKDNSPKQIDLISEQHCRNGIWISSSEFVSRNSTPQYYAAGRLEAANAEPLSGPDFPFGMLSLGVYGKMKFDEEAILKRIRFTESQTGPIGTLSTKEIDCVFHFDEKCRRLSKIEISIHRDIDKFTGKYGYDGKAILKPEFVEQRYDYREIEMDAEGRMRSYQLYFLDDTGWLPTRKVVVDSVQPNENGISEKIVFTKTKPPEQNNVYFEDDIAEYHFHDGQINRLFDASAYRVLEQMNGGQLRLDSPDSIPYVKRDYLRKSAARHCGLYAGAAVLIALKAELDCGQIFDRKYVSTAKGSSAADLITFFTDHNLKAKTYSGGSRQLLKQIAENGDMALLHFGNSNQGRELNHWVAFLGMDGDDVRILDLPRECESYSMAEVLTDWDGIAIVVSQQSVDGYSQASFFNGVWPLLFLTLIVLLAVRYISERKGKATQLTATVALLIAIAVLSTVWFFTDSTGFFYNQTAVHLVTSRQVKVEQKKISQIEAGQTALLIDARMPDDFERGHIPDAISLPVDFSVGEFRQATRQIPSKDAALIVYCANENCEWANVVSSRLNAMGYANTQVYVPGYAGFLQQRASDE